MRAVILTGFTPARMETRALIAASFKEKSAADLVALLRHPALQLVERAGRALPDDFPLAAMVTLVMRQQLRGSARSTMRFSSSAPYRCPLSRRGSTASSPKTAKAPTRIWSEQEPVAGGADAGFFQ